MGALLAVYLHNIDPYAIKLWEGGPIRWYGLSYLLGFLIAYWVIRRIARVGNSSLDPTTVGDFIVTIAIGIVAGGRLGYVLFYRPEMMWTWTTDAPYWDMLAINKGGMASHGGMIGAILGCGWFAWRAKGGPHSWMHLLDLVAIAATPGLFFGRIANFINGELIGRACSPTMTWGVKFPQEMYAWNEIQLSRLAQVLHEQYHQTATRIAGTYRDIPQIISQIQAGNDQLIRLVEPLLIARHPSQLYQALLEGLLLFVILAIVWIRPQTPGVICGLFCGAYGLLRIVGEFFRLPDAHIGFQWLGLTRGQWLSFFLVALGVAVLAFCAKRNVEPMGGWLAKRHSTTSNGT